jgi:glycerate kinase
MINAFLPNDVSKVKGAGSAGGICGGLYSIYGGEIKSGFDILANACELEEKIKDADIVVTGEGKTDKQTLMGKLPYKISQLCKKYDKKCVVISGIIDGVSIGDKCISLVDDSTTIEQAMTNAEKTLENKSKYILQ